MKQLALFLLAFTLLFAACKKESRTENTDSNTPGTPVGGSLNAPGYGPSTAAFKAPAWKLPEGIELVDSLHDLNFCFYMSTPPRFEQYKNFRGLPGGVAQLCGTLRNKTGSTITIHFPDALVVSSSHLMSQGVLLLFLGDVTLIPGSTKTVMAGGFCINQSRHVPEPYAEDGSILSYSFGPSDLPGPLAEIKDILKPKSLGYGSVLKGDGTPDIDKVTKLSVIQSAVWEVTDGEGLTQTTRQKLKDLSL
jgi:hypothetical protein